jgi:hypothetical protein
LDFLGNVKSDEGPVELRSVPTESCDTNLGGVWRRLAGDTRELNLFFVDLCELDLVDDSCNVRVQVVLTLDFIQELLLARLCSDNTIRPGRLRDDDITSVPNLGDRIADVVDLIEIKALEATRWSEEGFDCIDGITNPVKLPPVTYVEHSIKCPAIKL